MRKSLWLCATSLLLFGPASAVAAGAAPSMTPVQAAAVATVQSRVAALPPAQTITQFEQQVATLTPSVLAAVAQGPAAAQNLFNTVVPHSPAVAEIFLQHATQENSSGVVPAGPPPGPPSGAPQADPCNGDSTAWSQHLWLMSYGWGQEQIGKLQVNSAGWCWNGSSITKILPGQAGGNSDYFNQASYPYCWISYGNNLGGYPDPWWLYHLGEWASLGVEPWPGGPCPTITSYGYGSVTLELYYNGYWDTGY